MIRNLITIIIIFFCFTLISGCGQKSSWRKGGVVGSKPYSVRGKTYYPLKSANGFEEKGIASWYGPGFHGKTTANGETYNQYAMTAAHKILPLGTKVRVTNLENGRSVIVRINDRGPFVNDRIIDLSRAAATRLDMMGKGTARTHVQSLGGIQQVTASGTILGDFYIQIGAFTSMSNALKLYETLTKLGNKVRIAKGVNKMWNVQIGSWKDSASAQKKLNELIPIYPQAFIVADK